ncbi:hypothetical protein F5Y04DRAFT_106245 [Hypomontagnella monticulosa]|nr:hypothetical protein F5Y04DRAFT_106245 [Hypomontagnella monticulosa]
MNIYTFFIVFFLPYIAIATPTPEWQGNGALSDPKIANVTENATAQHYRGTTTNLTLQMLQTYQGKKDDVLDDIREYNRNHPNNQISDFYICPHPRVLASLFNSVAVWEAVRRGLWYLQHPSEPRPGWNGIYYPSYIDVREYFTRQVDLGETSGTLHAFPLNPRSLSEWPGFPDAPVVGPPGNHRVIFDESGRLAGVVVLWNGEEGADFVWCYPVHDSGFRDWGATAEGVAGVDEALRDNYDSFHFLDMTDPQWGSHPRYDPL